jgi:hypothetical protein
VSVYAPEAVGKLLFWFVLTQYKNFAYKIEIEVIRFSENVGTKYCTLHNYGCHYIPRLSSVGLYFLTLSELKITKICI